MTSAWGNRRARAVGVTLVGTLTVLAGCTADRPTTVGSPAPALRLVAFDSCADALAGRTGLECASARFRPDDLGTQH
ncbi:hypothetical protein ACFQ0D_30015, partial [Micromonospora zhanjiangensis]